MNITITPNTTAIDATVLNPVAKSFASGSGGGGGGGDTFFPSGVNADGAENAAPVVTAPTAESVLATFSMAFTGGKKAIMWGFSSITGVAGFTAKFRLYVDGVMVSQASVLATQVVGWGYEIAVTPVGSKTVEIRLYNDGSVPVTANQSSVLMTEML